jgi:hypothetical protein
VAKITDKKFPISAIRVKKFCANSVYESKIDKSGFIAPIPLAKALESTVNYEFVETHDRDSVFYTE